MHLEIIRDTAGLLQLESEWNELLADSESDCVFLTFEWLVTWWRHFHAGHELCVTTIRSGGRLVAIAPFIRCRWRRSPFRLFSALEFMGIAGVASEYLDVIVRRGEEAAVLDELSRTLADRRLMLDLSQLRTGRSFVQALGDRLSGRGWATSWLPIGPCPYIPLAGRTWDEYLATVGSQHRANVRRRLRDIQKHFRVQFELVTEEEQRGEALQALIRLHNARWDEHGQSMAFRAPEQLAFHEDVTRLLLARGWLRLFTLQLDGEVAAALYGFAYKGKFYFYQSGFSPVHGKHSLGLVTMALAIQASIAEQITEYDLLYGHEAYKTLWAPSSRGLVGVELCPPDARGRLHRASVRMRGMVRPARRFVRNVFKRASVLSPAVALARK